MTSLALDNARQLAARTLVASEHEIDAVTLGLAVTHRTDDFYTVPRFLALGRPGCGKSRLLSLSFRLSRSGGPPTGATVLTAPAYVMEYRQDPHYTPAVDEIHHVFGKAGNNGEKNKIYGLLNQGYNRDTAISKREEHGDNVAVPIFGVVFMAGLGLAVPADLRDRSIVIRMERAGTMPADFADFSREEVRDEFTRGKTLLSSWARSLPPLSSDTVRGIHPDLVHRRMEVWGPLFVMAHAAGSDWPDRCMTAFRRIELDAAVPQRDPETQLVLDFREYALSNPGHVASGKFAEYCAGRHQAAWSAMAPGEFARFATRVLGKTSSFKAGGKSGRGWPDGSDSYRLNMELADRMLASEKAAEEPPQTTPAEWEDF